MTPEDFEGKNLVELLDMLEPVPEPAAISMWPQTQGWLFLLLVVGLLALWGWLKWRDHHRANAYRRAALVALNDAGDDPVRIAEILRRTAVIGFSREAVAGLAGQDWLRFLDRNSAQGGFDSDLGRKMIAAPYKSGATDEVPGLQALAKVWVKSHHTEGAA
ncbi:DUF4381 domain-containing protein [Shimia thalassica]|uniref:DUF4381 domain-containing protein n=1 Tax=Shimia thalassica TaxID=1715693 RepID=UPI001C089074|nr:DUF4381 domain-containing protein [Shimia thalassica]MBU2941329.1 DUF4381 domain-containing protein [Shimia thalassica]MDO6503186.1 DUF4381 domain-containing protein [Shimia thalassica]